MTLVGRTTSPFLVMQLNIQLESLFNVPKLSGTFYLRWRALCDTHLIAKGRTTNASVKSFKVAWRETVRLDLPAAKPGSLIAIEFSAWELEGDGVTGGSGTGESVSVGSGTLAFTVGQHGPLESWSLLLEQSKVNAGIKCSTWFGDVKPYYIHLVELVF